MITMATTRQEIVDQLTEEYEATNSVVVKSTIARVNAMTQEQFENFLTRRVNAFNKYGQ